jgi:hypothetical protein
MTESELNLETVEQALSEFFKEPTKIKGIKLHGMYLDLEHVSDKQLVVE